ncbi:MULTISPECIES: hypothetical protein [Methylomonas]|uniref:VCBS repeat-containing protein n=2 Tax=Methylomonas TaxID=416 RepID=A0A140E6M1_9GAMM|nr:MULTISPECIES: hypothetical protein [Methylomonas]AMK79045.1 hypothetical protein JT25_021595 [Methylomonas denitrificans]OAI00208.1 hypothetical protein A1342_01420 [Methylomonas methanica]TCV79162.1 hypothetical protein EDE11_12136 [Methylomonas methanica]
MIIQNSAVKLQSQHQAQQLAKSSESLRIWIDKPENTPDKARSHRSEAADTLALSHAAQTSATESQPLDTETKLSSKDNLLLQIIRRMVKEITGRDFELFAPEDLKGQADQVTIQAPREAPATAASEREGYGLVYQKSESYFESETTSFSAEGNIQTKDGQNLNFSVSLSMSRSFYIESDLSIRAGDAVKTDPLVINFDGTAAELSNTRFQFDIDANGSLDQIAGLKAGSGMLALDKNQDGLINDGSELFGPKSGDGFADLATYDDDKNQFIDAGDAIYTQLRIWQRHEDGSQQLFALGDKNVGAIYLGHLTTPFQLKDTSNQALGEIASSGIYLTEQGKAGSVQQLNFLA